VRIGVIGPAWPDGFARNIIDGLAALGHAPVPLGSSFSLGGPYTSSAFAAIRNALPGIDERLQFRLAVVLETLS
jgi:hypothetical protein